MNTRALAQLAKSSYWQKVRDEWLRPKIHELTYAKSIDSELPAEDFKLKVMARAMAYEELENIISEIDSYATETREVETNPYI